MAEGGEELLPPGIIPRGAEDPPGIPAALLPVSGREDAGSGFGFVPPCRTRPLPRCCLGRVAPRAAERGAVLGGTGSAAAVPGSLPEGGSGGCPAPFAGARGKAPELPRSWPSPPACQPTPFSVHIPAVRVCVLL